MTAITSPDMVKRTMWAIGLGTGLSLLGDTSLYAVLPTHFEDAAVPLASIGILLSANRFIRLALNGPAGLLYDRLPRRRLFVPALFLGALSTAIYALTAGFWPLLMGRLLWGIAWVGIWVGSNTIILDISHTQNRGQRVGVHQISFFMGASSGAVLGGFLTDWLGYHQAMGIAALLTLLGAIIALLMLPETRRQHTSADSVAETQPANVVMPHPRRTSELGAAYGLLGVNRLALAGILLPTFGLFLKNHFGDTVTAAGVTMGVATLTGLALGINGLISMVAAPLFGRLSDRTHSRWGVAAGGLLPGIAGFGLLASASTAAPFLGIPLAAISSGSNQSLSTTLVGDLLGAGQQGKQLGLLFTVGDFASAVGPLLAYAIIPWLGLSLVYMLCVVGFSAMLAVCGYWATRPRSIYSSQ